jgi:hypothetical protein
MRSAVLIALFTGLAVTGSASAQSADQRQAVPQQSVTCPPDMKGESPTVGEGKNTEPLGDRLAQSKGVICPPNGRRSAGAGAPAGRRPAQGHLPARHARRRSERATQISSFPMVLSANGEGAVIYVLSDATWFMRSPGPRRRSLNQFLQSPWRRNVASAAAATRFPRTVQCVSLGR